MLLDLYAGGWGGVREEREHLRSWNRWLCSPFSISSFITFWGLESNGRTPRLLSSKRITLEEERGNEVKCK